MADRRARALVWLALIAAAVALRWHGIGNPLAGLDEQFYLLVGERMHDGLLPYRDIWDRKPAGLFAIYALAAWLPGDAVAAYQVLATLALVLTAAVVAQIARRRLSWPAAGLTGFAVVLWSILLGEGFGQTPIFYNLALSLAALNVVRAIDGDPNNARRGDLAMLLCGVALTIKTSTVFEGCALGLLLLYSQYRAGAALPTLARTALRYALIGLLPTLLVALFYLAIGSFDAFWFANFVSIFRRGDANIAGALANLTLVLVMLSPLLVVAAAEGRRVAKPDRAVLLAWLAGAAIEFASIGHFFPHYALSLIPPLALLASHILRSRSAVRVVAVLALAVTVFLARGDRAAVRENRQQLTTIVAAMPAAVRDQCLFVYEGPSALYSLSHACLPGRYVFPGHFTSPDESHALERSSSIILAETLARRPAAIVATDTGDTANDRLLRATLAKDYRRAGGGPVTLFGRHRIDAVVWRRRDL